MREVSIDHVVKKWEDYIDSMARKGAEDIQEYTSELEREKKVPTKQFEPTR